MHILFKNRDFSRWKGGLNYYNNLLRALHYCDRTTVTGLVHHDLPIELESHLINDIHPSFNPRRFSKYWWKRQFLRPFYDSKNIFLACHNWLHEYDVSFNIMHNDINKAIPSLSWIPDFQHVHLPYNFTSQQIENRDKGFSQLAEKSNGIIVSSKHAAKTFAELYPENAHKAHVLHFEVYVPKSLQELDTKKVRKKYNLPEVYIYLPNQYWKHKNHHLVIDALKNNDKYDLPPIVSSGSADDHRNPDYFSTLAKEFNSEKLQHSYRYLGEIPYQDVQALMLGAQAVLNPSFYEGWSTTVQEAKAFEKPLVLSDIEVHREQGVESTLYFDPHNPESLLKALYKVSKIEVKPANVNQLHEQSIERLRNVGNRFCEIADMAIEDFQ